MFIKLNRFKTLVNRALAAFSPSSLFANGEQGVWYDPSDINLAWRYNLLNYTEQFDNAYWTKSKVTISANATTAPDGTVTADKIVHAPTTLDSAGVSVTTPISFVAGQYIFSISAKKLEARYVQVLFSTALTTEFVDFDTDTGTITGGTYVSASITSQNSEFFRVSVTVNFAAASGNIFIRLVDTATAIRNATFSGAAGNGLFIWGAQLQLGSTATTYQPITDGIQDYYTYQAQPVMFQDSAGTTPVTAVEQPVGLLLDKSKGLALGSENVTSPITGTLGASYTIVGDTLVRNGSTGTAFLLSSGAVPTTTKTYLATFTVSNFSGDATGVRVGGGTAYGPFSGNGTFSLRVLGGGVGGAITFLPWGGGAATATYSNISVKELAGNHARQSTGTKRPVLSARYNLLTRTEEFDNAVWTAGGTTMTGSKTINTTTGVSAYRYIQIASGVSPNTSYTYSIDVLKTTGATTFPGLFLVFFTGGTTSSGGVTINTNTGVLTDRVGAAPTSKSSLDIGTHWRVTLQEVNNTNTVMRFDIYPAVNTDASGTWVSGITGSVTVDRAQLIATNSLLSNAYQRVNTSTDYDSTASNFPPYLKFDGTDDAMFTSSINFTTTDKMSVFSGVRWIAANTYGGIVGLNTTVSVAGSFLLWARIANNGGYEWYSTGTTVANLTETPNAVLPKSNVITVTTDIAQTSPNELGMRLNGVVATTTITGSAGTGNFSNAAITLGSYNSSNFFNGYLYSLIVRGASSTATQITDTETYVNSKTKAY